MSSLIREVAVVVAHVVLYLGAVGLGVVCLFFIVAKLLGGLHG